MVAVSNLPFLKSTDILLAAYPRSGTSWIMNLLYALDILVVEGYEHDLSAITSIADIPNGRFGALPELEQVNREGRNEELSIRVVKTHATPDQIRSSFCTLSRRLSILFNTGRFLFPDQRPLRAIYLCRDGRDAALSYYYYCKEFLNFKGSFDDFLKSPERPAAQWAKHVRGWTTKAGDYVRLLVRYEDMHTDLPLHVCRMLKFLHQAKSEGAITKSIADCQFNRLRQNEKTSRGLTQDEDMRFYFRHGKIGEWKEVFSQAHIEIFKSQAYDVLLEVGYEPF